MKKNTYKKILTALLPCMLLSMLCLGGCSGKQEPVSKTGFLFDTVVTITLYGSDRDQEELLEECFRKGEAYEQLFSRTIETSEISRINQAKGEPVTVSDDTRELIEKGLYYSELSGGAFDITIAPVSSLWDFKSADPSVPDADAISRAVQAVDYHTVHIDGNQVWLENPDAALDLGGIAKGFIADRLKEFLVSNGVSSGIINLGGNVLTIGQKPDGSLFRVGVRDPKDTGSSLAVISMGPGTVVTSGVYERCFEKDGVFYHHILDPETGLPAETDLTSATIVGQSSMDADAMATALIVMGREKALAFCEEHQVEAMFIDGEDNVTCTSGFAEKYALQAQK